MTVNETKNLIIGIGNYNNNNVLHGNNSDGRMSASCLSATISSIPDLRVRSPDWNTKARLSAIGDILNFITFIRVDKKLL